VGPRAGLDGCGKTRPPPTGIRFPDRPARSESLYRLSHPVHLEGKKYSINIFNAVQNLFMCSKGPVATA